MPKLDGAAILKKSETAAILKRKAPEKPEELPSIL
jgi:hypothetical protein